MGSAGSASLRRVLIVPYVALVLALALCIGVLSYRTGVEAVGAVSEHSLLETVGRIGQAVDRHVVGSGAVLEAAFPAGMAAPDSLADELRSMRERFWIATSLHIDPNNYVYYGNRAGQALGLYRHSAEEGELRLKLVAEEPRTFYRFTGINGALQSGEREKKLFDPRLRPWYKAGEASGAHTWTSVYIDFRTAELVATRAKRVLSARGEFEGVVATDVSLRALNDFVRSLQMTPNGLAFIMEPDGSLIASSATPYLRTLADGSSARLAANDCGNPLIARMSGEVRQALARDKALVLPQTRVFDGPDGGPIFAAFDRVKDDAGLEWLTVVAVPRGDFMSDVTGNVIRTAVVALLAAGVAVAIGMAILSWVARDLRRLADAARRVGDGELEAPVGIKRRDEIGALARSFEAMQLRLRTDKLTGLANREAFLRATLGAINAAQARGSELALLFVDLDGFKAINDRHGHDAGDRTLVEVGRRLRACVGSADRVARYAGDEFVVLVSDLHEPEHAQGLRQRIEAALQERFVVPLNDGQLEVNLSASVGLAHYPADGDEAQALIKCADADMYRRKFAERGGPPAL